MKIVSLNKNPERFGFLSEIDYKNEQFHGHQTALCIGIKRLDGTWDKVYTSGNTEEEKIGIANAMLEDKSLIILEEPITQREESGELVRKIVYHFPYYVADHSAYQPTVNFDQISYSCNTSNDVKIEVLFVHEEGWFNRYVTFDLHTSGSWGGGRSLSLMDFIEDLEREIEEAAEEKKDFFIADEDSDDYYEGDIVLDFYDKSGQKYLYGGKVSQFLDMVSSVRIIGIETKINKEDNDNGTEN